MGRIFSSLLFFVSHFRTSIRFSYLWSLTLVWSGEITDQFQSNSHQSALAMHFCLLVSALVCLITAGQYRAVRPPTFRYDLRVNKMIPAEREYLLLEPGTEMVYEYPNNSGRSCSLYI